MEDEFLCKKNHEVSEVTLTVFRLRSLLTYCSPVEIYMYDAICIFCVAFSKELSQCFTNSDPASTMFLLGTV